MPHGGKRDNAGRPKTKLSRSGKLNKATAEEILAEHDEKALWSELLEATVVVAVAVVDGESGQKEEIVVPDRKIRLEALKYLTDRRDGKAIQKHGGDDNSDPIRIFHSIPRPERTQ